MTETRIISFTADAYLVWFRAGEVLRHFWQDLKALETGDKAAVAEAIIACVL